MSAQPRRDDPEPISPELVLVSTPEDARRARERLPERPPLAVAPAPAPVAPSPPSYPRIAVEELPPEPRPRRRRATVLVACAIFAAFAAGGYLVGKRWHDQRSTPAALVPAPSPPRAGSATVPSATAPAARSATPQATAGSTPAATGSGAKPTTRAAKPGAAAAARHAGSLPARGWTWAPVKGARGYEVMFFRDRSVVLRMHPRHARLVFPAIFRFQAGEYRWMIWAARASSNGKPILHGTFVLTPGEAAAANEGRG